MALRIEDYAMIGDTESGALVGKNGSIDWLCAPRFELARVLRRSPWHGRQRLFGRLCQSVGCAAFSVVTAQARSSSRLSSRPMKARCGWWIACRHATGMPISFEWSRAYVGASRYRCASRPGLITVGSFRPSDALTRTYLLSRDPMRIHLRTPIDLRQTDGTASATFTVSEGERVPFHLAWYPSHLPRPEPIDPFNMTARTEARRGGNGRAAARGAARGERAEIAHHAEGADVRADGRHRRRADNVAAGGNRGERNGDYPSRRLRDGSFNAGAAGAERLHG